MGLIKQRKFIDKGETDGPICHLNVVCVGPYRPFCFNIPSDSTIVGGHPSYSLAKNVSKGQMVGLGR